MAEALLVVYDVETTGKDPEQGDDVIQLASLIHIEGTDEVFESNTYANPGRPIPAEASAVNHITDDMVRSAPPSPEAVRQWWASVVSLAVEYDRPIVLAGHNTQFDRRFIARHLMELLCPQICTFALAYRAVPTAPSHKLEFLYKEHLALAGRGELQAHDALADVVMSFDLLKHWQGHRSYLEMARWLEEPIELPTCPLGKNRGQPFEAMQYGYLKWLAGTPGMNPDVQFSARQAIKRRYA